MAPVDTPRDRVKLVAHKTKGDVIMPCNSDYMNATGYEVEISRVACLLDELAGKGTMKSWWSGYHPSVYGKVTRTLGDALVSQLCLALQSADVSKYSLELQTWWRDHQIADKERCERELAKAKSFSDREVILSKLTPHERKVLGF